LAEILYCLSYQEARDTYSRELDLFRLRCFFWPVVLHDTGSLSFLEFFPIQAVRVEG
jgi:hypothetical protein